MKALFLLWGLAWVVIAEARVDILWGGVVAVPLACWCSYRLRQDMTHRLHLARLPGFLIFFVRHSLSAGMNVALRALRPQPGLNPLLLDYPLRLPAGAREVLLATISLLPGTLSSRVEGDTLYVHALDEHGARESVIEAEARVAHLFGLDSGGVP